MKLYEFQGEIAKAAAEYAAVMEETEEAYRAGEIDLAELERRYDAAVEIYGEYLGFMDDEFEKKAEATAMVLLNLQAEAEVESAHAEPFEREAARYRNRQKGLERQAEHLKEYLKAQMERTGKLKVEGSRLKISVQQNSSPSVLISDPDAIPEAFILPQMPKLARVAVMLAHKEGQEIPGLEFVRGTHVRIR